mmetsp:Transcript_9455/g.26567  ORF Transcript_9455/g.26567 Transcript_9455/m.26567 type:complete len:285 (-) Transcript_9455:253-1107(-)
MCCQSLERQGGSRRMEERRHEACRHRQVHARHDRLAVLHGRGCGSGLWRLLARLIAFCAGLRVLLLVAALANLGQGEHARRACLGAPVGAPDGQHLLAAVRLLVHVEEGVPHRHREPGPTLAQGVLAAVGTARGGERLLHIHRSRGGALAARGWKAASLATRPSCRSCRGRGRSSCVRGGSCLCGDAGHPEAGVGCCLCRAGGLGGMDGWGVLLLQQGRQALATWLHSTQWRSVLEQIQGAPIERSRGRVLEEVPRLQGRDGEVALLLVPALGLASRARAVRAL